MPEIWVHQINLNLRQRKVNSRESDLILKLREEDELDYHIPKDADSDDPKAFNEVARCHTGYSFPRARVAWVDKNGESVNDCDNENYFDTSGCNADKDDSEVL